jgi:hypothetical protein
VQLAAAGAATASGSATRRALARRSRFMALLNPYLGEEVDPASGSIRRDRRRAID